MNSIICVCLFFILIALAVIADAIQDTITWKYDNSIFKNCKKRTYFDPNMSWVNKYKEGDPRKGSKFFGSTTIFVFVTDFYHLIKMIKLLCIYGSFALLLQNIWMFFILLLFHGFIFEMLLKLLKNDNTKL